MARKLVLVFLGSILFALSAQAAQAPATLNAVPIYSGAVRDGAAEAEATAEEERSLADANLYSQDGDDALIPRSFTIHVYKVAAPAEKVLQFYLDALGGTEGDGYEYLYNGNTAPGTVSRVFYQIHFVDFSVYSERDAKEEKALIKKVRKPFKPDKWVSTADFAWEVGEKNADVTNFDLQVVDDYFHTFDESGNKKIQTSIIIQRKTYMNPEDAWYARQNFRDEQEDREEFEQAETVRELSATVLNPEDMGISPYPGARYDADTTQFLKQTLAVNCAAYQSDDDALAIAAFYEGQAGFKKIHADENGALLKRCGEEYNEFLKRMMSTGECDAEITIQNSWMDMKTGKMMKNTLISIVNRAE